MTTEDAYMADAPWRGGDPSGEIDPQPPEIDQVYEAALADVPEDVLAVCVDKQMTGDKRWPVLCARDDRYASKTYCHTCHHRRTQ